MVTTERRTDRWHVGKEINLALILVVIVQTIGFVWWLSQLSSNVTSMRDLFAEFRAEKYTREDARRDRDLQDQKFQALISRDTELERRINNAEARIERIERK